MTSYPNNSRMRASSKLLATMDGWESKISIRPRSTTTITIVWSREIPDCQSQLTNRRWTLNPSSNLRSKATTHQVNRMTMKRSWRDCHLRTRCWAILKDTTSPLWVVSCNSSNSNNRIQWVNSNSLSLWYLDRQGSVLPPAKCSWTIFLKDTQVRFWMQDKLLNQTTLKPLSNRRRTRAKEIRFLSKTCNSNHLNPSHQNQPSHQVTNQ